ncbi:hypothetical protein TNCT_240971 [Trichonephila clavata]|uniref:Uncharacterized protein n=1 Tax=Trichonephila clavata TaxID=2740835 RepID=A0A8X6HU46_TRICU|nr:hypothetical protein TNCT_240971 [Trichonephila clavata]
MVVEDSEEQTPLTRQFNLSAGFGNLYDFSISESRFGNIEKIVFKLHDCMEKSAEESFARAAIWIEIKTPNRFSNLDIEEPPAALQDDANLADFDTDDPTIRSSTPFQYRPLPPITIDNIDRSAQLLKRLQDLTGQKLVSRTIAKAFESTPKPHLHIERSETS